MNDTNTQHGASDQCQCECECTAMGALAKEHELLKPFVGTFASTVTLWMGPGEPLVSTGTMTNTLVLGDRFLCQDYQGDPNDGPFSGFAGKGFWGYNTATSRFEGFWIDSCGTGMQLENGSVDESGRVWTMMGQSPDPQNPHSNNTITKKSIITLIDNDHHTLEMSFQSPDGSWNKCMKIEYRRTR